MLLFWLRILLQSPRSHLAHPWLYWDAVTDAFLGSRVNPLLPFLLTVSREKWEFLQLSHSSS